MQPALSIDDMDIPPMLPLIGGRFLHPDGVTVLFGRGGTGKGLIASWVARQLSIESVPTLILDFEQHPHEWITRLKGRVSKEIYYIDPAEDVAAITKEVAEQVGDLRIGCIILDSASRAVPEPLRGQGENAGIRKMFACIKSWGCPCLMIAHVPKATIKDGEQAKHVANPLGSIAYTNHARLTWSAIPVDIQGNVTGVETKVMKINDRRRPDTRGWEFNHDTGAVRVYPLGKRLFSVTMEAWKFLDRTKRAMTAGELVSELRADLPQYADKINRVSLNAMLIQRKELFRKVGRGFVSVERDGTFYGIEEVDEGNV